jgi:hypothetical protein
MTKPVHVVGSVALDSPEEVFATAGRLLRPCLKRLPDGEPGGRRMWVSWQIEFMRVHALPRNPGRRERGREA